MGATARYCELLFEAGDHEAAIAAAPAVSKDFWRQLLGKYAQELDSATALAVASHFDVILEVSH